MAKVPVTRKAKAADLQQKSSVPAAVGSGIGGVLGGIAGNAVPVVGPLVGAGLGSALGGLAGEYLGGEGQSPLGETLFGSEGNLEQISEESPEVQQARLALLARLHPELLYQLGVEKRPNHQFEEMNRLLGPRLSNVLSELSGRYGNGYGTSMHQNPIRGYQRGPQDFPSYNPNSQIYSDIGNLLGEGLGFGIEKAYDRFSNPQMQYMKQPLNQVMNELQPQQQAQPVSLPNEDMTSISPQQVDQMLQQRAQRNNVYPPGQSPRELYLRQRQGNINV